MCSRIGLHCNIALSRLYVESERYVMHINAAEKTTMVLGGRLKKLMPQWTNDRK